MLVCDNCGQSSDVRAVFTRVDGSAVMENMTARMAAELADTDLGGQSYQVDLCKPCRMQLLEPLYVLSPLGMYAAAHSAAKFGIEAQNVH